MLQGLRPFLLLHTMRIIRVTLFWYISYYILRTLKEEILPGI